MKLTHCRSIVTPSVKTGSDVVHSIQRSKVTALSYSLDGERLAVATSDRAISLYDNFGNCVDKFNTKPNGNGPKDYIIRSIQFGPDVDKPKLAIAQSDAIVFVYKWKTIESRQLTEPHNVKTALNKCSCWNGKKSICNKFIDESAITSLLWSKRDPFQIVYGTMEGKVRVGNLKTNTVKTLYKVPLNAIVSMTTNFNDTEMLSGHIDGSIYRFSFPNRSKSTSCMKIIVTDTVPYVLSWGKSICMGGTNNKIVFYNCDGQEEQSFIFDHKNIIESMEHTICNDLDHDFVSSDFTTSTCSPSGDSIIVGSYNCYYLFCFNATKKSWEEKSIAIVKNMHSVTAITWKPNGSAVVLGTSTGLIDLYNAAYHQFTFRDAYTITYVSPSQILVSDKNVVNSSPISIQSSRGEIVKVKIFRDPGTRMYRYVVASTKYSLIFCDMDSPRDSVSEIPWQFGNNFQEEFIFDAANACIISNVGELSIVEYGQNEILSSVRTEYTSPYLLSLRVNEYLPTAKSSNKIPIENIKVMAYLLDKQTICVRNLVKNSQITINNRAPIDFLELNTRGTIVVFRDNNRHLHMFDVVSQLKSLLLTQTSYVQWIPDCDVLVAQSNNKMLVWYNITALDQVTSIDIKGEIEGIERSDGKTEVIVSENGSITMYSLSENFIQFTNALQDNNLGMCVSILETMEESQETQAMWKDLRNIGIKTLDISILSRCAAALGNVSEVRFFRYLLKTFSDCKGKVSDSWEVKANILKLNREFVEAEKIYLSHNCPQDAIAMYEHLMMFKDALRIASTAEGSNTAEIAHSYLQRLQQYNQDIKIADIMESHGNYLDAIGTYVAAGFPAKALQTISEKDIIHPQIVLENVAAALYDSGLFAESGEILERIGEFQNALSHYIEGKSFKKAWILARDKVPSKVITIEELWGDSLVASGHYADAIDHFVNAHVHIKAAEAAVAAGIFNKAIEILEHNDDCSNYVLSLKEIANKGSKNSNRNSSRIF